MIKAAIQHRGRLIRAGLHHLLEQEPDLQSVGHVEDAAALVELCATERPDVVLLELDATEWDAARLVAALRKRQRALQVVGMHDGMTPEQGRRAYQAGIRHTVTYEMGADAVIAALRGRRTAPAVTRLPLARVPSVRNILTQREVEVLTLVASGQRTQEIGGELGISAKTVENHKQRLFRKLDVQNQAHAVSVAMRQGILGPIALVVD